MESADLIDECPEVARVALASATGHRDLWLSAFALDGRIGKMVLGATEPLLGQMRLAWWRDQLGKPVAERPRGDVLLDLIDRTWAGDESGLVALVDGWEALLSPRPLQEEARKQFVDGRGELLLAVADRMGEATKADRVRQAASLWALADLAVNARDESELAAALALGNRERTGRLQLPRKLRPLAVIGGLADRSLRSGGRAMLGDRFSPLIALRLSLFGR